MIPTKEGSTVTFETKVYEDDWKFVLAGKYLEKLIRYCDYDFADRVLFINNVKDLPRVIACAERKVDQGVIDRYYVVDEHASSALQHFELTRDSFRGGYYYSIAELVSLYLCKTDYLLHFSSDSYMVKGEAAWIDPAISILSSSSDVLVANPTWGNNYTQAQQESHGELGEFFLGYGFSDQCYLVRLSSFKKPIYNEVHPASARYPSYGGELFEKRVDSYMRVHQLQRISSKRASYIHKNFPRAKVLRLLYAGLLKMNCGFEYAWPFR